MSGAAPSSIIKVLVTGGAGFIGSHLVCELLGMGYRVSVIDDLSSGMRSNFLRCPGWRSEYLHVLDIANGPVERLIKKISPTIIYHLAAQTDVSQSHQDPVADAETNIIGTLRVLEGAVDARVKHIVFSSSAAVYGDAGYPISPYGASKLAAEGYVRMFPGSWTIFRFSNVYGPRAKGGVIPAFIQGVISRKEVEVFGDGGQRRDFIYVKDLIDACLVATRLGVCGTYNLSSGKSVGILDLAHTVAGIAGSGVHIKHLPARDGDIYHSTLDNTEFVNRSGWVPRTSLEKGIKETSEYLYPGSVK